MKMLSDFRLPAPGLAKLEGADHGFSVPKSSGRTRYDVWDDAVASLLAWADERFDA